MLTKRERWLMVQAFRAGYSRGHTDTAGGCYNGVCERENDCAFEWIDDMATQEIERGGKAEMSDTLSCSDSCCVFRTEPAAGMVTNGGCRCLSGLTSRQQKFIRDLRRENAELRKRLEQAHGGLRAILDHHEHQRALFYEAGDMDAADYHEERRNFARCFLPEPPK